MLVILCVPGPQLSTLVCSALLCAREAEPSGFLLGPDNGSSQQGAGGGSPTLLVWLHLPKTAAPAGQPFPPSPRLHGDSHSTSAPLTPQT